MNYKKSIIAVTIIIAMIISALGWFWTKGEFMNLKGKLLVSMSFNTETQFIPVGEVRQYVLRQLAIYTILLDGEEVREYFRNERYGEIQCPYQREKDFICVAKNLEGNYYAILQVKEDEISELMTSELPIYYPLLINNDSEIIFYREEGKESNRYHLCNYNLQLKRLTSFREISGSSKLNKLVLSPAGSILYSVSFTSGDRVKMLYRDGEVEDLVEGVLPSWFEEDKSFFYYDQRVKSLMLYDIPTRRKKIIHKNLILKGPLVISPDRRYIAFLEAVPVEPLLNNPVKFGEKIYLTIMTVDGWTKRSLKPYDNLLYKGNGLDWIR